MFCPGCGAENNQETTRFCRACGADLRAVSRALNKSLPGKIVSTVDSYLENRYQQNMRTGVMNLIAFVALLVVGLGHLAFGWPKLAAFMLGLSALSLAFGLWDIWIYRRNLPPARNQTSIPSSTNRKEIANTQREITPPLSIAEPTTRKLDLAGKEQEITNLGSDPKL
jgi:hypothetical protein